MLNEDLPDPYETIDTLDTDDIELNQKTSPHSILESDQQSIYNKQVQNLKQGLAAEEIMVYLDDFEEQVKQEILMIGNISLGEVQVQSIIYSFIQSIIYSFIQSIVYLHFRPVCGGG